MPHVGARIGGRQVPALWLSPLDWPLVNSDDQRVPSLQAAVARGAASVEILASGDVGFPVVTLTGEGDAILAAAYIEFPVFSLAGSGGIMATASGRVAWPPFSIDAVGGNIAGAGNLTIPAFLISGNGSVELSACGGIVFPRFVVRGLRARAGIDIRVQEWGKLASGAVVDVRGAGWSRPI